MSVFNGILNIATEITTEQARKELENVLLQDEKINYAFKLVRDLIVFTEYRLILVDKQGLTGKKIDYNSLPYKNISRFSIETAGHFDLDAELKIWISSAVEPVCDLKFRDDENVRTIQQALASAVLL